MASLKLALTGVALEVLLAPTTESGTLMAPLLGLDDRSVGPAGVPEPPDEPPDEPPEPLPPDDPEPSPPTTPPGTTVPGTTELEAAGLEDKPGILAGVVVPPATGSKPSGVRLMPGPEPPPEPQAVKLRARINPKAQLSGLDGQSGFFMAIACAFQGEVKNRRRQGLRKNTYCAAAGQNGPCDFLTPA
jgi:hypothetical protein